MNTLEVRHEINFNERIEDTSSLTLEVKENDAWDGIQVIYQMVQDEVYSIELQANTDSKNVLLEIILLTEKKEIRVKSFVLEASQKIQFVLAPIYDSSSISFRMSTFGGFSSGKIELKELKISSLFPITDHDDLISKIKLLGPWFHQINLDGVKTRLVSCTDSPSRNAGYVEYFTEQDFIDNPIWIWDKFEGEITQDLRGKKVLDIASNAGFYSFELAKRGAQVTSLDNSYDDIVKAKFAKKILGVENVSFELGDVNDLEEMFKEKFDLVLCLGLLYHVKNPKEIIKKVSKISDFVIFETIANVNKQESELIEDRAITTDGFVPTVPWLKEAFEEMGFTEIKQITEENFPRVVFKCKRKSVQ